MLPFNPYFGAWAENRTTATEIFLGTDVDSDEEIFEKIKAGCNVLGEIVLDIDRRYANDLLKFCGRILITYEIQRVQDVVQEVFMAVYRSIQQYDMKRGAEGIKPWLYKIAYNKCVDELRKKYNREVPIPDFTELEPSNPGGQEKENLDTLILKKKAFFKLDDDDRLMIATDLMGWFSRKELAEMFGYNNPNSYDRQMSRIEKKMRNIIEGKCDGDSK